MNRTSTERPTFSAEQRAAIFRAACRRVAAAVLDQHAQSCRESLGEAAMTPVYGAFVTLRRAGRLRACCGVIESALPLWKAVERAAERSATDDPRFEPIAASELHQLDVDVWILWGPQPIGARGESRVQAVTIGRHGLLIGRGAARGLLLPGVAVEHRLDARAFLEQVCIKAGLPKDAWLDDDVELLGFEGEAIEGPMALDGPDARPPAVAGGFYPGEPREIERAVDKLLAAAGSVLPEPWSGALVPHAGWMYSGRLAADVLSRIAMPPQAIVFCPHHRSGGSRWAAAPHGRWQFPGGGLDADGDLARRLAGAIDGLELDAEAHREEHAIEVQLPILARLAPELRVTGIVIGESSLADLLRFGGQLADVLRDMPRPPLLIVSSDMNHFVDEEETRRVDSIALESIESLDPVRVFETVRRHRISMCGMASCVIAMETLRQLGRLNRCQRVGYATSAEAGGPTDRVVGYAGLLFR